MLGFKATLFSTILLVWLVLVQGLFWMMLIAVHPVLGLLAFAAVVTGLTYMRGKHRARERRSLLEPQKPFSEALNEYLKLLEK